MQLRHKSSKRKVKAKLRDDRAEAVGPNDVWAIHFVHDKLATGMEPSGGPRIGLGSEIGKLCLRPIHG